MYENEHGIEVTGDRVSGPGSGSRIHQGQDVKSLVITPAQQQDLGDSGAMQAMVAVQGVVWHQPRNNILCKNLFGSLLYGTNLSMRNL